LEIAQIKPASSDFIYFSTAFESFLSPLILKSMQ